MALISCDGGVMKTDFLSIKVDFRYVLSAFLDLFFKGFRGMLSYIFFHDCFAFEKSDF